MNNVVNFILESGVSLALLSLIYMLFLRKETFFRLNRIFLLISVTFSLLLPFLKFRVYEPQSNMLAEVTVTPYRNLMEAVTIYGQDLSGTLVQTISSSRIIIFVYLAGLLFFLGRLIFRLIQIAGLIYGNPVKYVGTVKFVSVNKEFSPFSFLGYIFVNPEKRKENGYERIVAHEMEHIKQGHTFDVLILEIMIVFQWFNPFMWMLKRVIRENHEFLADRAVLNSGISAAQYKYLLLSQSIGFQIDMANSFNSSMVKSRMKMISKIRSSKLANFKYVFGILTVLALVVVFACEQKQVIASGKELVGDSNERIVKISLLDDKMKIEGDQSDLECIKKLFSENNNHVLEADSSGDMYLVKSTEPNLKLSDEGEQILFVVENTPEYSSTTRNERAVRVSLLANKMKIKGNKADLGYIKQLFSEKNKHELETDRFGDTYLVKKAEPKLKSLDAGEQIFFIVENMPEFPGGDLALRNYIASTVKYPEMALETGIQGKVYVTFVVSADGSVANAKIARGVDATIDKEALRVVNSLPRWKPGFQRGKAVNVSYTVPINFIL